jgi:predicted ATPase
MEAARGLGSRFADGVRFVDLAPVQSAEFVPAAIAAGLGLNSSGGRLLSDVLSYLCPKRVLLILDNFEQVAGAAPLIAELLAAAPELVVLATSRSVLRINGEHEFPVPPLAVPPTGTGRDPAGLRRYAAVRLFLDRADAAAPGFALNRHNAPAVAEICRRLDGLPLAIELAAARIRLLPPRALLARLDQGMSVLAGGPRDLPERQRTLRNTLEWSFNLLSAERSAATSKATCPARRACSKRGSQWRSRPETGQLSPTTSRRSVPSRATRAIPNEPWACSRPPPRSSRPAGAAGSTPTCHAPAWG